MNSKELIKQILLTGTPEEKKELFAFDSTTPKERILKKFKIFARGNYPRYFKNKSALFHDDFIRDMIDSYYGQNRVEAAFRGSAKTSLKKLFDVFILLNDRTPTKKYIKVLTRDGKNSKQIVTDVYNLIVEVKGIYGNIFEKDEDIKREETMTSFTTKGGRKYAAGTVGQVQRGHVQDAYRPDWIWFDDVEDKDSIGSIVITESVIGQIQEAIDGLSIDGSFFCTANYISDQGTIQWLMNKHSVKTRITPLLSNHEDNSSVAWEIYSPEMVEIIKKDAEDFFGEYQCLKPDTLIYTDKKLKEISLIKVGDSVWTHLNRLRKVVKIFKNKADDLLDITVNGKITTITKNHPVLVFRGEISTWVTAEELNTTDIMKAYKIQKLNHLSIKD